MDDNATAVIGKLNELIGASWTATAQHLAHVEQVRAWGLNGLATQMELHVADEPVTIRALSARLLDLGGTFRVSLGTPNIGVTLGEVLRNDLDAELGARPALNAAAEFAVAHHDATTRILLEKVLADEEAHLKWLQTEVDLDERLGEPLYMAKRMDSAP